MFVYLKKKCFSQKYFLEILISWMRASFSYLKRCGLMVCLLIENDNQEIGMNDMFTYLNKKLKENQNGGFHLKIKNNY